LPVVVRQEAENNFRAYVDEHARIEEPDQPLRLEGDLDGMHGSHRRRGAPRGIVEVKFEDS
jgi:hypothetical protein